MRKKDPEKVLIPGTLLRHLYSLLWNSIQIWAGLYISQNQLAPSNNIERYVSCNLRLEEMRNNPVNVNARMDIIKKRKKPELIYHQINVTQPYSTLNLEFKVDNISTTRLVLLGRHGKLPTIKDCEIVKIIGDIQETDEDCKWRYYK